MPCPQQQRMKSPPIISQQQSGTTGSGRPGTYPFRPSLHAVGLMGAPALRKRFGTRRCSGPCWRRVPGVPRCVGGAPAHLMMPFR